MTYRTTCNICGTSWVLSDDNHYDQSVVIRNHGIQHLKDSNLLPFL